jgi:hypothetical protein
MGQEDTEEGPEDTERRNGGHGAEERRTRSGGTEDTEED